MALHFPQCKLLLITKVHIFIQPTTTLVPTRKLQPNYKNGLVLLLPWKTMVVIAKAAELWKIAVSSFENKPIIPPNFLTNTSQLNLVQ